MKIKKHLDISILSNIIKSKNYQDSFYRNALINNHLLNKKLTHIDYLKNNNDTIYCWIYYFKNKKYKFSKAIRIKYVKS